MLKLVYKLMAVVIAGGLWIFYRLGGGGAHRDEIKELLQETRNKIRSSSDEKNKSLG